MSTKQMQDEIHSLRDEMKKLAKERDWLFQEVVTDSAVEAHNKEWNSKSYEECLEEAKFLIQNHLEKIHN
jgi:ElaB/YqjD/DUF883 family membrane-anchored ribosome-binding protein